MKRTEKQNNSLHVTLRDYASALNSGGYSYKKFVQEGMKKGVEIDWTEHNIKEMFDLVTLSMYDKTSSELSTVEIQECWANFARHMLKLSGINFEWSSKEAQMMKEFFIDEQP